MIFLDAFGMRMVEEARVTGILLNDSDIVSVIIVNTNGGTDESPAVTVVAFSGTMDMMSLMLASPGSLKSLINESSSGNNSIYAASNTIYNGTVIGSANNGNNSLSFGNSMNPLGLFENMKIGSSMLQQGWNSPQHVTVRLVDNNTGAPTPSAREPDTTFVFVMVFPFIERTEAAPATVG
jgi:hypothetical protein